jgi:hypothetical protein
MRAEDSRARKKNRKKTYPTAKRVHRLQNFFEKKTYPPPFPRTYIGRVRFFEGRCHEAS